jgi:clan AA aspartic protease
MITGFVSNTRAYVPLSLQGSAEREAQVEFVLDTGFGGYLTLPPAACTLLGLTYIRPQPVRMADGDRVILEVHEVRLSWHGEERTAEVLAKDGAPLLGMGLLKGSRLEITVQDGGNVAILPG